ncbi:MAG: hypothetical protein KatS3mg131_3093 [Candidatus Tectimicrobiota bacterium]|nr:MAG: hypothetical protein KatS3mg131_3093 [Candidatus Tectomicrobia bacterium]
MRKFFVLFVVGLALTLAGTLVAAAESGQASPVKDLSLTVHTDGAGAPARVYRDFTATEVKVEGDTLVIAGTLSGPAPRERARVTLTLPVQQRAEDPYWQALYEQQRTPSGQ